MADCTKTHGLLGTDVLSFDPVSVYANRVEVIGEGALKGFKASIKLKENVHPVFHECRNIPLHLRPAVTKL